MALWKSMKFVDIDRITGIIGNIRIITSRLSIPDTILRCKEEIHNVSIDSTIEIV